MKGDTRNLDYSSHGLEPQVRHEEDDGGAIPGFLRGTRSPIRHESFEAHVSYSYSLNPYRGAI